MLGNRKTPMGITGPKDELAWLGNKKKKKSEGTPEAKLYLCCHTWHLQALGLVLLGSGTG